MGMRRWLLALLLLWLALSPGCSGGPVFEANDGMEPGEGRILTLVHPKGIRSAGGQNGWRKYRRPRPRPRPRLSHKGPMPF